MRDKYDVKYINFNRILIGLLSVFFWIRFFVFVFFMFYLVCCIKFMFFCLVIWWGMVLFCGDFIIVGIMFFFVVEFNGL